ncbi:hypothetical protein [Aureibacter tunicatorum]|uniref:Uncharacterized protein n=1 Tax=Aureibacter tunicatorum TaxID=866807 RepID=A0AAE4BTD7_9BACT|nr:hypothetical protein [Aureibacter tunicatorum]MDR6242094.1 hypothetical protein [Aureibacter tunicatorum]
MSVKKSQLVIVKKFSLSERSEFENFREQEEILVKFSLPRFFAYFLINGESKKKESKQPQSHQ